MFANPTLQDFSSWITWHLDKAAVAGEKAVTKVRSNFALHGASGSSREVIVALEAIHKEFDRGIDAALGELSRAIKRDLLEHDDLRRITEESLRAFAERMKAAVPLHRVPDFKAKVAELDTRLDFALRQFDVGHLDPREPEEPLTMSNSINIGVMSGGAIQQGTSESTQNFEVDLATRVLADFEAALASEDVPHNQLANIRADIATIKAQLAKPEPSRAILREAGKSVRSVVEGVFAGAITNRVVEAAVALGRVFGA